MNDSQLHHRPDIPGANGKVPTILEAVYRHFRSLTEDQKLAEAQTQEYAKQIKALDAQADLLKACAAALAGYRGWDKMIHAAYAKATGAQQ